LTGRGRAEHPHARIECAGDRIACRGHPGRVDPVHGAVPVGRLGEHLEQLARRSGLHLRVGFDRLGGGLRSWVTSTGVVYDGRVADWAVTG